MPMTRNISKPSASRIAARRQRKRTVITSRLGPRDLPSPMREGGRREERLVPCSMLRQHVADSEAALRSEELEEVAQAEEREADRERRVKAEHRDAEGRADLAGAPDE